MKKLLVLMLFAALTAPAMADDKPQDMVMIDISTEGFVVTQSANITVMVEAAADDAKAAGLRVEMQKAVATLATPLAGSQWRLIGFNRYQDSTGLTRWQATYEARVAEKDLSGINDRATAASRAGMKVSIGGLDFTPTLAENEAAKGELRATLYKRAQEELGKLNAAMPGGGYRLAVINFASGGGMPPMPYARSMMMKAMAAPEMAMTDASVGSGGGQSAAVAQRIIVTATVGYAK